MTGLRTLGTTAPVDRRQLQAPSPTCARRLLGAVVTSNVGGDRVTVRIVETEAYREDDPASHSFRGRTSRTEPMFGPAGHSYVYFTYGMHHCVNISCEPKGVGAAVLLRAGIVLEGADVARRRRAGAGDRDLARGPARLASALGLDRTWSGLDTLAPDVPLRLMSDGWVANDDEIVCGPRTGVRHAADTPWRFWIEGVPEVSPHRRHRKAER